MAFCVSFRKTPPVTESIQKESIAVAAGISIKVIGNRETRETTDA
jgi:hypothetical protein